ncbi:MAG TPA: lysylphosphatidylglycerol synthase transmembrane domain-containing protein [Vicinamibacterales bacterium]|nr:lysylphosphatidylglycerol synthase transmembrane domain-containing protein [Vicinamibacterales bacterium]
MLIRLAITAAILVVLSRGLDFRESARAITAMDPRYLAVVLVLVAIDRCVMILRWLLLLRASSVAISAGAAARLFLISSFVGSFLPAGIGADAARAYGLSRESTSGSEALASVAVDRAMGVLSLVIMAMVGLIAWQPAQQDPRMLVAILGLTAASLALFWSNYWLRMAVPDRHHGHFVVRRALRLGDALGRYRDRQGVLVHVLAWSIGIQLLRISQAYYLGLGLGMTVPYSYYLLFMPIGLLMLLLPISISGFGLPQGIIVWLLRPVGVPDAQSFALSTLIILTGLAGNLPGLWLWLRQRREIL